MTVHYATADGSATAGSDYMAASGDVIIAGRTDQRRPSRSRSTATASPSRTRPSPSTSPPRPTRPSPTARGSAPSSTTSRCISINDVTVTEGNTGTRPATFTVSLSAAYDQPVTVDYATANGTATAGSDYQAASGTLTIAAGQTSGTFTVLVIGDRLGRAERDLRRQPEQPHQRRHRRRPGRSAPSSTTSRASASTTRAVTEGNTGTRPATFTVSLSAAYDVPVTVNYATANGTATAGSDYQAASGTLTIPAGQTSGTITVLVNGDRLASRTRPSSST